MHIIYIHEPFWNTGYAGRKRERKRDRVKKKKQPSNREEKGQ